MWNSILLSWQLILGVLVMFALFMAALIWMEHRSGFKSSANRGSGQHHVRTEKPRPTAHVIRVVRCEGQDRAA